MDEALPRPDRIRTLDGARFGWIAAEALRDGWLRVVSHRATAVYALLCLAADARGASHYGVDHLGLELGLEQGEVQLALARLEQLQLVASRAETRQVLPVPAGGPRPRVPSFGGR